jgi:hypothetical protein
MRFLTRSLVAILLGALALGFLGIAAITLRDTLTEIAERESRPRAAREQVFTARVLPIRQEDVTPGSVCVWRGARAARLDHARADLRAAFWTWATGSKMGQAVRAGQLLMRLDPADARASRDLAAQRYARAEAELADARAR